MGGSHKKRFNGLFDNGTFLTSEMVLPIDEVIPVKLSLEGKMNGNGGLDNLKAIIFLRGDMQIKNE